MIRAQEVVPVCKMKSFTGHTSIQQAISFREELRISGIPEKCIKSASVKTSVMNKEVNYLDTYNFCGVFYIHSSEASGEPHLVDISRIELFSAVFTESFFGSPEKQLDNEVLNYVNKLCENGIPFNCITISVDATSEFNSECPSTDHGRCFVVTYAHTETISA